MARSGRSARPFTVDHFCYWASNMTLDNGESWEVEQYFRDFLADVFAGFGICWLVVPEENAKTTNVGGLALYTIEHQEDAYVPVAASSRDQAEWLYRQASGFVRRAGLDDPSRAHLNLEPRPHVFRCLEGYRRIRHDFTNSRIQVFAADDRGGDGIIPGGLAIIDELHRHRDLALYRTWVGKLRKRRATLVIMSTGGEIGSEFEEERERLRQRGTSISMNGPCFTRCEHVLDDERKMAVIHDWSVPEDGDVDDLELVKAANPFSGITVETLREKRAMTPSLQHWTRFTANRASRSEEAAITEKEWNEQRTDERVPRGTPISLGLDVGWIYDTTAMVGLWMPSPTKRLLTPATVLTPPRDGTQLDPHLVEAALIRIDEVNPIETVVMDTHRAEQLASWIEEELGCTVIDRQQTNAFACEDYESFMEGLREHWLWHAGDPEMTAHAMNAIARLLPGGQVRFDRPKLGSREGPRQNMMVIDALTAASMVHSAMTRLEMPLKPMAVFV